MKPFRGAGCNLLLPISYNPHKVSLVLPWDSITYRYYAPVVPVDTFFEQRTQTTIVFLVRIRRLKRGNFITDQTDKGCL